MTDGSKQTNKSINICTGQKFCAPTVNGGNQASWERGKGKYFAKCLNANNGVKTIGDDNRARGNVFIEKKNILSIFWIEKTICSNVYFVSFSTFF